MAKKSEAGLSEGELLVSARILALHAHYGNLAGREDAGHCVFAHAVMAPSVLEARDSAELVAALKSAKDSDSALHDVLERAKRAEAGNHDLEKKVKNLQASVESGDKANKALQAKLQGAVEKGKALAAKLEARDAARAPAPKSAGEGKPQDSEGAKSVEGAK